MPIAVPISLSNRLFHDEASAEAVGKQVAGAVPHKNCRNADSLDRVSRPEITPGTEKGFFLEGKLCEEGCYFLIHGINAYGFSIASCWEEYINPALTFVLSVTSNVDQEAFEL